LHATVRTGRNVELTHAGRVFEKHFGINYFACVQY
jgi:hypothetical protein